MWTKVTNIKHQLEICFLPYTNITQQDSVHLFCRVMCICSKYLRKVWLWKATFLHILVCHGQKLQGRFWPYFKFHPGGKNSEILLEPNYNSISSCINFQCGAAAALKPLLIQAIIAFNRAALVPLSKDDTCCKKKLYMLSKII